MLASSPFGRHGLESVIGPDRTQQLADGAEHAITSIPDLRIIERDFEKPEHGNQQEVL